MEKESQIARWLTQQLAPISWTQWIGIGIALVRKAFNLI
jgi:hypothetical protein